MKTRIILEGSNVHKWERFLIHETTVWLYDVWNFGIEEKIESILKNQDVSLETVVQELTIAWEKPFALVLQRQEEVIACVDHIQSYPLFVYSKKEEIIVTDSPRNIEGIDSEPVSKANVQSFLFTRYPLGNRTFLQNLIQILAGQYAVIRKGEVQLKEHYVYWNHAQNDFDVQSASRQFKKILLDICADYLEKAGGRQIVLFLSGGYDSRIILWALDQLGATNVVLCSFGRFWQRDVNWARKFSALTPYRWYRVNKNFRISRKHYQSEERHKFHQQSHKYSSMPHMQEVIGKKGLLEKKIINDDAVFITGMSGDFISGGHIPSNLEAGSSLAECVEEIRKKHGVMWNWADADQAVKENVLSQIRSDLRDKNEEQDTISLYEWWEWRERQSKLMVMGSLQEFAWYGKKCFLPLWDKAIMKFFEEVPLEYRRSQKIYRMICEETVFSNGVKFTDSAFTVPEKAPLLFKFRRAAEFFMHPNWGRYTYADCKKARRFCKEIIGTGKLDNLPRIAAMSNPLLILDILKKHKRIQ